MRKNKLLPWQQKLIFFSPSDIRKVNNNNENVNVALFIKLKKSLNMRVSLTLIFFNLENKL